MTTARTPARTPHISNKYKSATAVTKYDSTRSSNVEMQHPTQFHANVNDVKMDVIVVSCSLISSSKAGSNWLGHSRGLLWMWLRQVEAPLGVRTGRSPAWGAEDPGWRGNAIGPGIAAVARSCHWHRNGQHRPHRESVYIKERRRFGSAGQPRNTMGEPSMRFQQWDAGHVEHDDRNSAAEI